MAWGRRPCTGQLAVRRQGLGAVGVTGVVGGGLKVSWGTVLAGVVGGIAGIAVACQKQRAAGVSPRWSRQRASSPAAVAVAVVAGIADGRLEALDR